MNKILITTQTVISKRGSRAVPVVHCPSTNCPLTIQNCWKCPSHGKGEFAYINCSWPDPIEHFKTSQEADNAQEKKS